VQTGPQVAPNVVNLPGARRVYAGEGLTALGGAITKAAAVVEEKVSKAEEEADKAVADAAYGDIVTDTIKWRVGREGQAYRDWTSKDGTTKSGVETEYSQRLVKSVADRSAKMTVNQRKILDAKVLGLSARWQEELLGYETKAVTEEAVKGAASVLTATVNDAASKVVDFRREDYGTEGYRRTVAVLSVGADEPVFKAQVDKLVEAQGLYGAAADETRRLAAEDYHILLAQTMLANGNLPKAAARAYVENLAAQNKLSPKNPKVRALVDQVTGESTKERVEEAAQAAVKKAGAAKGGLTQAREAWVADKKPGEDALAPLVERRIEAIYTQVEEERYVEDTKGTALLYQFKVLADRYNVTDLTDPRLSINGKTPQDGLKSWRAMSELQTSLNEVKRDSLRSPKGVPGDIVSDAGVSVYRLFRTLPLAQQATMADLGHPLFAEVDPNEVAVIANLARSAEATGVGQVRAEVNALVQRVEGMVKSHPGLDLSDKVQAKEAGIVAKDFLRDRYALNKTLTTKDFQDAELAAFMGVGVGITPDKPYFLGKSDTPFTDRDAERTKFITPVMRSAASADGALAMRGLSRVFAPGTRVFVGPGGVVRATKPGEKPPPGWREHTLSGGAREFDAAF
jgi:hypothetical protein